MSIASIGGTLVFPSAPVEIRLRNSTSGACVSSAVLRDAESAALVQNPADELEQIIHPEGLADKSLGACFQ